MNQVQPTNDTHKDMPALWHTAFRPLFLFASFFAVLVMPLWFFVWQGWQFPGSLYYGPTLWHLHEMVFAYGLAVIGGFLLTAIKTWTGIQTAQFGQLKVLVFLWLLGRLSLMIPGFNPWLLAGVESLFAFSLCYFVAVPLLQAGNKRNYKMIAVVACLALLNVSIHLAVIFEQHIWALQAAQLAFFLIILLIAVMAGRVFPMFSQNGVQHRYQAKVYPFIENSWPIFYLPFVFLMVLFPTTSWTTVPLIVLSLLNAVIHGWRLAGWYNRQIWSYPLVWVLHVGYAFLVLGFLAMAVVSYHISFKYLALHLLTMGTFSLITLGMMARVSFGHTGRNLKQPPRVLFWCFLLVVLATITRVVLPVFAVMPYHWTVAVSVSLWMLAFALFCWRYWAIWRSPRVDGKPG